MFCNPTSSRLANKGENPGSVLVAAPRAEMAWSCPAVMMTTAAVAAAVRNAGPVMTSSLRWEPDRGVGPGHFKSRAIVLRGDGRHGSPRDVTASRGGDSWRDVDREEMRRWSGAQSEIGGHPRGNVLRGHQVADNRHGGGT